MWRYVIVVRNNHLNFRTATSAYTCIFGASYSEGQRISSSVVRCRVPRDLSIGRHLFNLAPEGSISVIPNFDVRPVSVIRRFTSVEVMGLQMHISA